MASDLCERNEGRGATPGDQEDISSFFLASGLVIEEFSAVLRDFLASGLLAPTSPDDAGAIRLRPARPPEGTPEDSIDAVAARCAILLRREFEG